MFPGHRPAPATDGDRVLPRDPVTVLTSAALLALAAAAWFHVVSSSLGSRPEAHMRSMDSMSAASPTLAAGVAFVVAWAVMMTAMMLPSALPMIALYAATQRSAGATAKGVPVAVFTLVYLALWAAVGAPVYLASVVAGALAPAVVPYGLALVLLAAGVYQLSPLKQVCLRACRSPLGFLLGRWRAGYRGSLALGWAHALYCLGCCWALMVVLVAAGAMGLAWVLLVTAVVAAEKLVPRGEWVARAAGGALVLLGVAVALRPDLVMLLRGHPMM
jgi:predicted metal-binding membrane protein